MKQTVEKPRINSRSLSAAQRIEQAAAAATEVLAKFGSRGLTHRQVDRHLDWPEGSTSNYFRTRNDLFAAIAEHIIRLDSVMFDSLEYSLTQSGGVTLKNFVEHTVELALMWMAPDHRLLTLAAAEIQFESTRNPVVREAARREIGKLNRWHLRSFELLGSPDPVASAELFSMLMSSLLVGFSFADKQPDEGALRALVLAWTEISLDHAQGSQRDVGKERAASAKV